MDNITRPSVERCHLIPLDLRCKSSSCESESATTFWGWRLPTGTKEGSHQTSRQLRWIFQLSRKKALSDGIAKRSDWLQSQKVCVLCQHKCPQSLCLAQRLCSASLNLPALQAFSTCCSILLWWQSSHHQASHWRQLQSLADERIRVHIVCTSLSSQNALRMKCAT